MMEKNEIKPLELINNKVIYRGDGGHFFIDCQLLLELYPVLYERLINFPEEFISYIKDNQDITKSQIVPVNIPQHLIIPISNIRAENLNKLVAVKGILRKTYQVSPKLESIVFECPSCGTHIKILQLKNSVSYPIKCSCGNRRNFVEIERNHINIQELELEENIDDVGSRQPQRIFLLLKNELTDPGFNKFQVGNKVEVIGIVKPRPLYLSHSDIEKVVLEFILNAINIRMLDSSETDLIITDEDEIQIKEIASNNPLDYLSRNIAPSISGLDEIKKACVLALAKGVTKNFPDSNRKRGEIHILICGEPGVAKSALIQNIQKRVVNCRLIDGKSSSRAGIVYSLIKDKSTEKWLLEAGDLVLCNKGFLLADEFEKIGEDDRKALHGPMEQGVVYISKASIHAELKAETAIIACANPRLGSFSGDANIISQIDIPSTLLNRFDLIFVLKDIPDLDNDRIKADTILKSHMGDITPELSCEFIKKYFIYCSRIRPKLSKEIAEKIKSIYPKFRAESFVNGQKVGMPISPRHLDAIIRMSEAHAKLRLSPDVNSDDVDVACELFRKSLKDFAIDEATGKYDLSKITSKVNISKKDKYYVALELFRELSRTTSEISEEFFISELNARFGYEKWQCLDLLRLLHTNLDIFNSRNNYYRLTEKNT